MKKLFPKSKDREKHVSYFKMLESFRENGCPLCSRNKTAANNYIDNLLYENVNDPEIRKRLRESLGFCSVHSQLLLQLSDSFGTAIIYSDLLSQFEKILEQNYSRFFQRKKCRVCELLEIETKENIELLVRYADDPEFKKKFEQSEGLCAAHLIELLTSCTNQRQREYFLSIHKKKVEVLKKDLNELIRKNNYRFHQEKITEAESKSWIKAVNLLNRKF